MSQVRTRDVQQRAQNKRSLTPQVTTRGEQQRAQNKRISHATGENKRCAAKSTEQKDLSCHRLRTRGVQQRAQNKRISHATGEN